MVDALPVAFASPLLMVADPSLVFSASPKFPATEWSASSPSLSASCSASASLSESLPVALLPPVWARALPLLRTSLSWSTSTTPPKRPLVVTLASWVMLVVEWFPVAVASPESMVAWPSEELVADPSLLTTDSSLGGPAPETAPCTVFARLSDSLPTAVFLPVLAVAVPELETLPDWLTRTTPPRLPAAVTLAIWLTPVVERFPVALASPVLMLALPSDALVVSPSLPAPDPLPSPSASCEVLAVLSEALPVAVLPPVVAVAEPSFSTSASWLTITMLPRQPRSPHLSVVSTSTTCSTVVVERLPVAVASPVWMSAVPSELFVVSAVLLDAPVALSDEPEAAPVWSVAAVLSDSLPVPVLPPVDALAFPSLETSASWSAITMHPPRPQTYCGSTLCLTVVSGSDPVAAAPPVSVSLVPSPAFAVLAVLDALFSGVSAFLPSSCSAAWTGPPNSMSTTIENAVNSNPTAVRSRADTPVF